MAIQIPNPGTGNGATGDNEFVLWSKVKDNFTNTTHAASRLVGTATGNVMEVGAFGVGNSQMALPNLSGVSKSGFYFGTMPVSETDAFPSIIVKKTPLSTGVSLSLKRSSISYVISTIGTTTTILSYIGETNTVVSYSEVYTTSNTTKDANGFLKGASPVVDMYDNKIDLNHDAEKQGGITFEKLGVGDYLIKGSLGFAQEGWYIEMPKDANGNVLVAVIYEQLANNDLRIKTYAKRFDDETGDIVANLLKPRDIPTGRFISLRLHELPKEPPVMPDDAQTEV